MGKRKKSSRKPAAPSAARRRQPLDTAFTCLFCNHDKSVTVRIDRKEGIAQLVCRVCDQRYQSKVNLKVHRRPATSSSRPAPAALPSFDSDED
ncbi:hypothetical protein F5141DRAFT_1116732 [Pisolithus sp. B1]|nr:hypothetical protein F5141DRAFT_1116732 [Pisolithus sp. B1]